MRLATFTHRGHTRVGMVDGDGVIDTAAAGGIPRDMPGVLAGGQGVRKTLEALAASAAPRIPLAELKLEAPVLQPRKFLAIGLNYGEHIAETGLERPAFPTFFNKQVSCVNGPYDPIHRPRVSEKLDYEGELGFVIARRCRHVPRERAEDVIGGYLIVNDVSVRDWQAQAPTMTLGKSFDTHGPIGPWIVTADELGDPLALEIQTWVNDERRQCFGTAEMLFTPADMVAVLSTAFTLEPGDIISTGTGSGVGVKMKPRGYLKAGDTVRVSISGIGELANPVIEEPPDTDLI